MRNPSALIFGSLTAMLTASSAYAGGLTPIEPITSVAPMRDTGGEYRICTGSPANSYYEKATLMSGFVSAQSGETVVAYPAGGTVDCLYRLAAGEVQAAIVQRDGMAWLHRTDSPLYGQLGIGGNVLTEELLAFCSRSKVGDSDLNDVLQGIFGSTDAAIAIAGGPASGTNLTFNVLDSFDSDIGGERDFFYADGLGDALQRVKDGFAACAVAVLSSDNFGLEELDDTYGDAVRLVEFWDGDVRSLKFPGGEFDDGQVYGWRYIPKKHDGMDDFLDWRGNSSKGTWSPSTVAFSATLVYRTDATDGDMANALRRGVAEVASVKDDLKD